MNTHKNARLTPQGRLLLLQAPEAGASLREVAARAPMSARRLWIWWARYQADGVAGLQDRSSRPHRSPGQTPRAIRRQIVRLRARRQSSRQIATTVQRPLSTIVQVQRRLGWGRLPPLIPRPPVCRHERRVPGALIHLDTKKLGRIGRVGHRIHGDRRTRVRGIGWETLHVAIDDATRLAYAALFPDDSAVGTTAFLQAASQWFAAHGIRDRALMTDNGGGYRSHRFQALRRQLGWRHLWTRPYTPRTNGKAERFIGTSLDRWAYAAAYRTSREQAQALPKWLRYYNEERPHTALGFTTPAQRLAARL